MLNFLPGQNNFLIKAGIITFIFLVILIFPGAGDPVDKSFEHLYSLSAGQPQPDTNIVIINITAEDIERIGPWPIQRSYYALLINSLSKYGVKKTGLEIFLSTRLVTQAIYDNLLTREIQSAGNVVLSSVAGGIKQAGSDDNIKYVTDSLSYPTPKLIDRSIPTGHINFIENGNIQIPLEIKGLHSTERAFSLELADTIKDFNGGAISLNIFASWQKYRHYSLLEYFNLVQEKDSSLYNLKGKTVLIGLSDPQIAPLFESYFEQDIPGVAIHAFAIDNILNFRWFHTGYFTISKFIFLFLVLLIMIINSRLNWGSLFFYFITFTIFVFVTFVLFKFFHLQISYASFILPFFALIAVNVSFYIIEKKKQLEGANDENIAVKNLLIKKENEVSILEKELGIHPESSTTLLEKLRELKTQIEKMKKSENDSEPAPELPENEILDFEGIVYRSKAMSSVIDLITKTAPENANVFIVGESGTGKELAAKAIHLQSKRKDKNFVAVNCGALSENLLESELFGHVKGAFSGAVSDKIGRFQAADKGSIFLDEIAETSENFQVKLLRIIQTGTFEKVGSSKTEHADVRIIAATNKNPEAAVKEKKFREDLYYRLNVIRLDIPPLRERKADIEILAKYFLSKESAGLNLSGAVNEALNNYEWKGNVRELEAVIKRAAIFARSSGRSLVQLIDLPQEIVKNSKYYFDDLVIESLRNKKFSHSSITETAKELGNVSRTLVSENFRGFLLKAYVENNFDETAAAESASAYGETEVLNKVKNKLLIYLKNIQNDLDESGVKTLEQFKEKYPAKYKNLPPKYHVYLDEIILNKIKEL